MYMNSVLKYISLHKNKRWTINEDIRLVECSPCRLVNRAGLLIRGSFHKTGTCNDKPSCRVLKIVQMTSGDITSQHRHCMFNVNSQRICVTTVAL